MGEGHGFAKRSSGCFPQFVGQGEHLVAYQNGIVDARIGNGFGKGRVITRTMIAELLHCAQHGDAAARVGAGELRQSGAHRSGVWHYSFRR